MTKWESVMFMAFVIAGFTCADPTPKSAPEPAWMANFRKAYELKEGQYVKRVASPYIRERIDFILDAYAPPKYPDADRERREYFLKNAKWFTVFTDQVGTKLRKTRILSFMGLSLNPNSQRGDNLFEVSDAVEQITGMSKPEFIVDPRFAKDPLFEKGNLTVHGDFVVRKNAPIEKLAEQLEAILRTECKIPCKLRVDTVEQDVYLAQGAFKITPPEWRKASDNKRLKQLIDVYATKDALNPDYDHFNLEQRRADMGPVNSAQYSGSPVELVRFLGERINMRMVWEGELPSEPAVSWCNHTRKNPTPQEKADDADPVKVLKNMESQIGLTFKKDTRKVPVLVIYPSELK